MRDDPREILKAAGAECPEVDALWPLQTEMPRGGLYPDSVALAILALAWLVAEKQGQVERRKVCGNCGRPDMEDTIGDVILCPETDCGLDGTETRHHVPCWFTPSRWTPCRYAEQKASDE